MNQVIEILLKFLQTRDWKASFFQVIPQRKRCEAGSEANSEEQQGEEDGGESEEEDYQSERKKKCVEATASDN